MTFPGPIPSRGPLPGPGPRGSFGAVRPPHRFTPGVGLHQVTPDTPRRPDSSFVEIANPLGYEEKRTGMGGGINSERHIQDLMGGMSVVMIFGLAFISSIAFPPLFVVWIIVAIWALFVQVIQPYGQKQLALEAQARARASGELPTEHAAPPQRWYPGAPQ